MKKGGGRGGRGGGAARGDSVKKSPHRVAPIAAQPEPGSAEAAVAVSEGLALLGGQVSQLQQTNDALADLIASQAAALASAAAERPAWDFQVRALAAFDALSARTQTLEDKPAAAARTPPRARVNQEIKTEPSSDDDIVLGDGRRTRRVTVPADLGIGTEPGGSTEPEPDPVVTARPAPNASAAGEVLCAECKDKPVFVGSLYCGQACKASFVAKKERATAAIAVAERGTRHAGHVKLCCLHNCWRECYVHVGPDGAQQRLSAC